MIINGGSRSNGAFFAKHLMRADQNERVTVTEMRGFGYAEDVPEAFQEMREISTGTRIKNFFYHANINTRPDEVLTPEQWAQAVDTLESQLHLEGQPRFIVEHDKEGRIHRHVVWSRIDTDSMTAVSDSHNYRAHELASREIEQAFDLEPVASTLTRDKETTERAERRPSDWESFRAAESKIDPQAMKAELSTLWQQSDSGTAFAAALEERGYILAKGDRRDYCVIDPTGDEHSLARRISGVKAAEIRSRMEDIDRDSLPSVEEGRALAQQRQVEQQEPPAPFDAIMEERKEEAASPASASVVAEAAVTPETPPDRFQAILADREEEAAISPQALGEPQDDAPGGRFERVRAWWQGVREYFSEQRDYYAAQWSAYTNRDDTDVAEAPNEQIQPSTGPEL